MSISNQYDSPFVNLKVDLDQNKIENELEFQQNLTFPFGCHLQMEQFEPLHKQSSNLSSVLPPLTHQDKPSKGNIGMISKLFMIFKKNKKNQLINEQRYLNFQKMYEEKLFHPELQAKVLIKYKFLFDSNNTYYLVWQQFKLFFIFFLLLFINFYWSFEDLNQFMDNTAFAFVIYFLLLIDIIAQFNVTIIIKGQIIRDRAQIIQSYVFGTFIEDFTFLVTLFTLQKTQYQLVAVLFYISGIKILFDLIHKFQEVFDFSFQSSEKVKLIKLVLFINITAHFIACLWHFAGQNTEDLQNNWLDFKGIKNQSQYIRYIYSFYWSVTTMATVGYGDITPQNHVEMMVSIFVILISCGIFGYSLNFIGQIVQTYNQFQRKIDRSFRSLNNYFKQHNINDQLQNRAKNYLEYKIREEEKESLSEVFDQLSRTLKEEIIEETFLKMLPQTPILQNNFSQSILNHAAHLLDILYFQPGDCILTSHSWIKDDSSLYFIESGTVQVWEQQSNTNLFEISSGQTFGLCQFFTEEQPKFSFICKSEARIFKLSKNDFVKLLTKDDFESFHQLKHCYQFNIPITGTMCKLCNSAEHQTENCKLIFFGHQNQCFIPKRENLKQSRVPIKRKQFRYQTVLNSSSLLEQQFKFFQNYQQETSNEQIDDIVNITKTAESGSNSAANAIKGSEQQITQEQENNQIRQMKANQKSDTRLRSNFKEKSLILQDRFVVLEIDKMRSFNKFFQEQNFDNQIEKYNHAQFQKNKEFFLFSHKLSKTMRFIKQF